VQRRGPCTYAPTRGAVSPAVDQMIGAVDGGRKHVVCRPLPDLKQVACQRGALEINPFAHS